MGALLSVSDLIVDYRAQGEWRRVLDRVSFSVAPGEIVGVIGESGCGKSTLAKAILRTLPDSARAAGGRVELAGQDLLSLTERQMRQVRWRQVSMIFQSAMNALNPVYRVGDQIAEALRTHGQPGREHGWRRARELLDLVGVDAERVSAYPHELSGGMRQRVCIALALALHPQLVLADEPTTALDVVTQDRVLKLLRRLRDSLGISVILISHDLSVIAETCDRVVVLYGGRVLECGPTRQVLHSPLHPYTMGLINAFPEVGEQRELVAIPGHPPGPGHQLTGCNFAPRCPFAQASCRAVEPQLAEWQPGHASACPPGLEQRAEFAARAARPETWGEGVTA